MRGWVIWVAGGFQDRVQRLAQRFQRFVQFAADGFGGAECFLENFFVVVLFDARKHAPSCPRQMRTALLGSGKTRNKDRDEDAAGNP